MAEEVEKKKLTDEATKKAAAEIEKRKRQKREKDPIFTACFVVFVIACAAVLVSFVNDEYVQADESKVAYGDTVVVNYTGTYYAYYMDEDGNVSAIAVVFDTTDEDIGTGDDTLLANTFSRSSYETIEVTVGDGDYLTDFENCLIGHMIGDTVYVTIEEAYVAASEAETVSLTTTIPMVQTISRSTFDDLYGDDYDLDNGTAYITTAYGWDAWAVFNSADNTVTLTYLVEAGETYYYTGNTYEDDDDEEVTNPYGTVSFTVNSVDGQTMSVTYTFEDFTYVSDDGTEIQMIELALDDGTIYVTDIDVDNQTFTYKTCGETYNITLYFMLTIESIE